ncbi:hypothetical protein [Streptomyces sindenensis]|uniref:Uncharacterized protein n=1 Tax=Streptomyces sindenensis TaxID=67363 RepID=A0ABW6EJ86_9ACTN|nr:hypothetical protein [Streptomyces sindenensis]
MDLTAAQWQLLGELVSAPMTDPSHGADSTATAAARGLDPQLFPADSALLTWMKLAELSGDLLVVTDLGVALHYRRLQELLELRLSEVARFAAAHEPSAPWFARNVRLLAEGSLSFADAMREPRRTA